MAKSWLDSIARVFVIVVVDKQSRSTEMVSRRLYSNSVRAISHGQRDWRVRCAQERDSIGLVRVIGACAQVSQSARSFALPDRKQHGSGLLLCERLSEGILRSQIARHALLIDARHSTRYAQSWLLQQRVFPSASRSTRTTRERPYLLLLLFTVDVYIVAHIDN